MNLDAAQHSDVIKPEEGVAGISVDRRMNEPLGVQRQWHDGFPVDDVRREDWRDGYADVALPNWRQRCVLGRRLRGLRLVHWRAEPDAGDDFDRALRGR